MADVVRWIFYDPGTAETHVFSINPKSGGSPGYKKTFTFANTAAPDGKTLVFQGRAEVQNLVFEGTILEQADLDAFVTWWQKQNQIVVTDDLGRTFSIIIQEFTPKRERAVHSPWKHSYSCSAVIVDWPA